MTDAIQRLRNGDDVPREEILEAVDRLLEMYLDRGRKIEDLICPHSCDLSAVVSSENLYRTREILASCGVDWWRSKRPVGWDHDRHAQTPAVNTVTDRERQLACAVADYLEARKAI